MSWSYGREVKLGYGYDLNYDYIYPFKCSPQKIWVEEGNHFWSDVIDVNSKINYLKGKLGLFLCDEGLNYLNFLNKYDNDEYYLIELRLQNKFKGCRKCNKYPKSIPEFISDISYGINIHFWIKKNKFLNKNQYEVRDLLKCVYDKKDLSKLTSEQLETKCEVVINDKEKKWMTLKEIYEIFLDKQNIEKNESALYFYTSPVPNNNTNNVTIKNEYQLRSLMYDLYIFYQKIEKCFAKSLDIKFEHLNFNEIKTKLEKSKNEFKNVDERDTIGIYQITKKLFRCYQAYLDYMLKNRLNVEDEEVEVYQSWIEKLKNATTKMSMYRNKNGILLNIKNIKFNHHVSLTSDDLFKKCPSITCNEYDDFRKWKCSICDEFMKIETVKCDCGYKQFDELTFYCKDEAKRLIFKKLNQIKENDKNNTQVEYLAALLCNATGKKFIDTLTLILDFDINEEMNQIIKEYFYILKITKLNSSFEEESDNKPTKMGYIKSFSVPPKMLNDNVEDVDYLFIKCPLSDECKDEKLKPHFCFECISYTKIETLTCKCGEKGYNNLHLICDNEKHTKKFNETVKNLILNQLEKPENDMKVQNFLKFFKKSDTNLFDETMLNLLQTLDLDGDTKQLIKEYQMQDKTF